MITLRIVQSINQTAEIVTYRVFGKYCLYLYSGWGGGGGLEEDGEVGSVWVGAEHREDLVGEGEYTQWDICAYVTTFNLCLSMHKSISPPISLAMFINFLMTAAGKYASLLIDYLISFGSYRFTFNKNSIFHLEKITIFFIIKKSLLSHPSHFLLIIIHIKPVWSKAWTDGRTDGQSNL